MTLMLLDKVAMSDAQRRLVPSRTTLRR